MKVSIHSEAPKHFHPIRKLTNNSVFFHIFRPSTRGNLWVEWERHQFYLTGKFWEGTDSVAEGIDHVGPDSSKQEPTWQVCLPPHTSQHGVVLPKVRSPRGVCCLTGEVPHLPPVRLCAGVLQWPGHSISETQDVEVQMQNAHADLCPLLPSA